MSTRTNIEFIDENGEKVLLYQHSEGYIEGMMNEFVEFFKWYGNPYDLEYSTANFIYFAKRYIEDWAIKWEKKKAKEDGIKGKKFNWEQEDVKHNIHLGHGICQPEQLHGDIEYFYRIHVGNKEVVIVQVWEVPRHKEYKSLVESKPTVTFHFDPKQFKIQYIDGDFKRKDVEAVIKKIGYAKPEVSIVE